MLDEFKVFGFLKEDIQKLEQYLQGFARGLDGILQEGITNTLLAGGKRIRPALFFISARNKKYDIDYLLPAAASIEIIHTASLIHDDIIDKSELRRGKKTIHSIYDNDTAKYIGNYLFTHTFSLLNSYSQPRILSEMSYAAENLVKGEFNQLKKHKKLNQDEDYYFNMINEKTSSLFKASCALGGMLSGSTKADIDKLRSFGQLLGTAFQINDDLLDIGVNRKGSIGKPIGNDIRQENVTLPVIYALKDPELKDSVKRILGKANKSEKDISLMLDMINRTGAVNTAKAKFESYLARAQKAVDSIGGQQRREGLLKILDYFKS
ncbi:MAG: polyprenyl synthetase family protein [Actinomycetota bacterium]